MTKIFIDPGHGGTDPGAVANGLQEKVLTLDISKRIESILNNEYEGVQVRLSRTGDQTLALNQRTDMANAWGANYLISVHINSGGGTGSETFSYNGSYNGKAATNQKRDIIHDEVIKETGFHDRGKKEANLHMVRESRMQSVLTESGFIDNASDAALLKQPSFLDKIARGHANGLEKALGLKKKMMSGWILTAGKWYFYESGVKKTGWLSHAGHWYYLDSNGVMQTGWVKVDGKWYLLSSSGAMLTGLQQASGRWYLLAKDGSMLENTTIAIDKSGALQI